MSTKPTNLPEVPPPVSCSCFHAGHKVHWVQMQVSQREGPGEPCTVASVADDGVITLADGSTLWHHDPARLRAALVHTGNQALLAPRSILKVDSEDGWCCFSVAQEPDPCDELCSVVIPGESIVDELKRRGGFTVDPMEVDPTTLVRRPKRGTKPKAIK